MIKYHRQFVEFIDDHMVIIAVARACWHPTEPSYSWHVLEWLCWKQRLKHPLVRRQDTIVGYDMVS
jgi:hypothetical protein